MCPRTILSHDSLKAMNEMLLWPDRVRTGRRLFMLAMAARCRDKVRALAPKIDGEDYARDLRVGFVSGVDSDSMVAIYFEDKKRRLREKDAADAVLIVSALSNSPKFVFVLQQYGPWPASMLPVKLEPEEAKVIRRNVREDELNGIRRRILEKRIVIETELRNAGAPKVNIADGDNHVGLEAHDDIGFAVLRKEFGFHGKQESHWRPAIRSLKAEMPRLLAIFLEYIKTGKSELFDGEEDEPITAKKYSSGVGFQAKIIK